MQKNNLHKFLLYSLLTVIGFILLYPLIYAILVSLMGIGEYSKSTSLFPISANPSLMKYITILSFGDVAYWFRNTVFRVLWYLAFILGTSIVLGYFYAKRNFAGKKFTFYLLLSTMMIPNVATIVPLFIIFARWPFAGGNDVFLGGHGILNTWGAVLLPGLFNVYSMFLTKQFYETLPGEYEESAKIDGAGTFRLIFQIYTPMLKPVLAFIFITISVQLWNDYQISLFFTNDGGGKNLMQLAYGMTKLTRLLSESKVDNNILIDYPSAFAGYVLALLPTIVLYVKFQRYVVQGFVASGIKG